MSGKEVSKSVGTVIRLKKQDFHGVKILVVSVINLISVFRVDYRTVFQVAHARVLVPSTVVSKVPKAAVIPMSRADTYHLIISHFHYD